MTQALIDALERVKHELMIPAAEYVPAIPDCWKIIDDAVNEYNRATYSPIPAAPSDVAGVVKRLRAKPNVASHDSALRNPDGPEAAALIQSLSHDREVMREALEDVVSAVAYTEVDCGRRSYGLKTSFGAAFQKARAALASLKGGA